MYVALGFQDSIESSSRGNLPDFLSSNVASRSLPIIFAGDDLAQFTKSYAATQLRPHGAGTRELLDKHLHEAEATEATSINA